MKVLTLENGQIKLLEETLIIPEFANLWNKHKDKEKSRKEFLFVYFFADYNSPYLNYDVEERKTVLSKDYGVTPNEITFAAIEKYKDLNYTFNMRYLDSAINAAKKMQSYFDTVDLKELDNAGRPIHKPSELNKCISEAPKILSSVQTLREKVENEILHESRIRGGGNVNKREQ